VQKTERGFAGHLKHNILFINMIDFVQKLINMFSNLFEKKTNATPLIVYSMGKVGSTSILESLKDLRLEVPIYHAHWLTKESLNRAKLWADKHYEKSTPVTVGNIPIQS
jgi:hypothetical protein